MKLKPSASLFGLALSGIFIFAACNNATEEKKEGPDSTATPPAATDHTQHNMEDTATVPMVNHAEVVLTGTYPDTSVQGTAVFDVVDGKVKMKLDINVPMKAGKSVAVHLHEHGDCGDSGKASHGHWNPTNAQHGKWGSASFHLGDIGNVQLDKSGKGSTTVETDLWTLGGKPGGNILGKALIVHGGVDDYTTQPTGNAGSRIGCGVIK